jgi:preprotein translocase subunit SecD
LKEFSKPSMTWKRDIKVTKRKTMLKTKHSKDNVTMTSLASTKNLPTLSKRTQNCKHTLTNSNQSTTKRLDKESPSWLKRLSSKRLWMKQQKRELKKILTSKPQEKNSTSSPQSSLKPEDSSQTTYKPQPSYKRDKTKQSTSHHKCSLKLPPT